ncbi:bifunctional DNA primase/polymerase [Candidatus Pacearchaeota archaeon]|nr:bifunctional DNA primase/polymerase [Candidatus Pacearchaeota archaeon]
MHKAALEYIQRGWYVFPLHSIVNGQCTCGKQGCSDAGKHPRTSRGLKEATRDLSLVETWFGPGAPPSNIAILTGELSGLTVIDIDIGEGKFGADSWAEATREHGDPKTLMAETGSGGMHVLFQYNSALKTASNVLGKGIDSRNDGGYIVAPPSLHRTGGIYKWENPGTELAVLPAHLSRRKETRGRPRKDDPYRGKYTIEQISSMLEHVPADDRDLWRAVGIIMGREFNRAEQAWDAYVNWASSWKGKKGRKHDDIMNEAFHILSQQEAENELTFGTIVKAAIDNGWAPKNGEVPISQFIFYGPGNNYIYRPTRQMFVAGAVDSLVSPVNENGKIVKPTEWLKRNQPVTSMTCDPAIKTDYLKGHDCREGEVVQTLGAALYNSYCPSTIELGDAKLAQPFLEHINMMFNREGDAEQFLNYMAHRVQKPWEKPRFALLISGGQGVGKDTAIEFCGPAIGVWNFANIDPSALESGFNEYVSATLIRINEAANLHDMTKWAFNEKTKVLIAGSPDICQINPKYGQKYSVRMHCGVVLTTNHLADGIYIPQDDRRYDVIECATLVEMSLGEEDVRREYFTDLWEWFIKGGGSHVAAFLHEKELGSFSPSNGQRKTEAHKTIVAGGMSGDHWLGDILSNMGDPIAVRSDWITIKAVAAGDKIGNVRKKLSNSIGRAGYSMLRSTSKDGRWKIGGKKVTVYAKPGLPEDYDPVKELEKEPW